MTPRQSLPSWVDAMLRLVLGTDVRARSMMGDLHEDYQHRSPGVTRSVRYALAALLLALRYVPVIVRAHLQQGTRSGVMDALWVETRHAARSLRRSPTYVAGSALTLALALGSIGTIATTVYGALWRPLPYPSAEELVRLGDAPAARLDAGMSSVSMPNFLDERARTRAFASLAAYSLQSSVVSSDRLSERIMGAEVTGNFFRTLGLLPLRGRWLEERDDHPDSPNVVVIGERSWRRHFGEDPATVGRTILLDLTPYTVVGVAPESVFLPGAPEAWTTLRSNSTALGNRRRRMIEPIGRLLPGVTVTRAQEDLRRIFAGLAQEHPAENRGWTMAVQPFDEWLRDSRGASARSMLVLIGAGACILLLVALINMTSLALGRSERGRRDTVVRRALGASASRLLAHRLIEQLLLTVPSAVAGGCLTAWLVPLIVTSYGDGIPRSATIAFDSSSVVAVAMTSILCALVVALVTSLRTAAASRELKVDVRGASAGLRLRRMLVTGQVGLASVLLYGATVITGTLWALSRVGLGVPLDHAITFSVQVPAGRYHDSQRIVSFFDGLISRLQSMPGVDAVGAATRRPFSGGTNGPASALDDPAHPLPVVEYRAVTPNFFRALGVRLEAGEWFGSSPVQDDARTVVISESLSRALHLGPHAVGRKLLFDGPFPFDVVGIVSDVRDFGPTQPERPTAYWRYGATGGLQASPWMHIVVREGDGAADPIALSRDVLRRVDPDVPFDNPATLQELADRSAGISRRTASMVLSLFTLIAVLLGAIGIFGVVAFSVERRTRELGMRLAMGDTPAGVRHRVVGEALRLTAAGLGLGFVARLWVEPLVRAFVVEQVQPSPAFVGAGVVSVLIAVTVAASLLPARRAGAVSVTEALRSE